MGTKAKRSRRTQTRRPGRDGVLPGSDPRATAILTAAFDAFMVHGYAGATTAEIARRAQVSKRDVYRRFGSKDDLFAALVADRAERMRRALTLEQPADSAAALATLERFGREFLGELVRPTTIALYRLAIAEAQRLPVLARTMDDQGREVVMGQVAAWIADQQQRGLWPAADPEPAAANFMALLMGNLPVRLMLGVMDTPGPDEIGARAVRATRAFQRLWLGDAIGRPLGLATRRTATDRRRGGGRS